MPVVVPEKTLEEFSKIIEPDDFKAAVFKKLGNSRPRVFGNRIMCAVYIANERLTEVTTKAGLVIPLYKTKDQIKEDIWQGKPCLVIAKGEAAFKDTPQYPFYGDDVQVGDWVTFQVAAGKQLEYERMPCRIVYDWQIDQVVPDPRMVTS
jgi:hypothetical protein